MRKLIFIIPGSSALEIGLGSLGFSEVFVDFYKEPQKPADLITDTILEITNILDDKGGIQKKPQ